MILKEMLKNYLWLGTEVTQIFWVTMLYIAITICQVFIVYFLFLILGIGKTSLFIASSKISNVPYYQVNVSNGIWASIKTEVEDRVIDEQPTKIKLIVERVVLHIITQTIRNFKSSLLNENITIQNLELPTRNDDHSMRNEYIYTQLENLCLDLIKLFGDRYGVIIFDEFQCFKSDITKDQLDNNEFNGAQDLYAHYFFNVVNFICTKTKKIIFCFSGTSTALYSTIVFSPCKNSKRLQRIVPLKLFNPDKIGYVLEYLGL